jgi:hypothetical protein
VADEFKRTVEILVSLTLTSVTIYSLLPTLRPMLWASQHRGFWSKTSAWKIDVSIFE